MAKRAAKRRASTASTTTRPSVTRQRVLWQSNAPFAATGYSVQTAQVVSRLAKDGHECAIACNYGLQGADTMWNNVKLYPTGMTPYSDDILRAHSQHWFAGSELPGLVIVLFDVWALKNPTIMNIPKIAAWAPIDHQPAPPDVADWLRRPNVFPIAMSKFGSRMMEAESLEHVYIPHGFDPVFKPTQTMRDATGATITGRDIMKLPEDAFVVMINAANKGRTPPRKAWAENLLAFGIFAEKHPDAMLYLHTDMTPATDGVDMQRLLRACNIPESRVRWIDQYMYRMNFPQEALAALYSSADVLLACSAGEGFGIPVIEAQACGTRPIVSNFSAQPELVGEGWIVDGQPLWDPFQNAWFFSPRVDEIVYALEQAYAAPAGPSAGCLEHMKAYAADHVYETHWRPAMEMFARWEP